MPAHTSHVSSETASRPPHKNKAHQWLASVEPSFDVNPGGQGVQNPTAAGSCEKVPRGHSAHLPLAATYEPAGQRWQAVAPASDTCPGGQGLHAALCRPGAGLNVLGGQVWHWGPGRKQVGDGQMARAKEAEPLFSAKAHVVLSLNRGRAVGAGMLSRHMRRSSATGMGRKCWPGRCGTGARDGSKLGRVTGAGQIEEVKLLLAAKAHVGPFRETERLGPECSPYICGKGAFTGMRERGHEEHLSHDTS